MRKIKLIEISPPRDDSDSIVQRSYNTHINGITYYSRNYQKMSLFLAKVASDYTNVGLEANEVYIDIFRHYREFWAMNTDRWGQKERSSLQREIYQKLMAVEHALDFAFDRSTHISSAFGANAYANDFLRKAINNMKYLCDNLRNVYVESFQYNYSLVRIDHIISRLIRFTERLDRSPFEHLEEYDVHVKEIEIAKNIAS